MRLPIQSKPVTRVFGMNGVSTHQVGPSQVTVPTVADLLPGSVSLGLKEICLRSCVRHQWQITPDGPQRVCVQWEEVCVPTGELELVWNPPPVGEPIIPDINGPDGPFPPIRGIDTMR